MASARRKKTTKKRESVESLYNRLVPAVVAQNWKAVEAIQKKIDIIKNTEAMKKPAKKPTKREKERAKREEKVKKTEAAERIKWAKKRKREPGKPYRDSRGRWHDKNGKFASKAKIATWIEWEIKKWKIETEHSDWLAFQHIYQNYTDEALRTLWFSGKL